MPARTQAKYSRDVARCWLIARTRSQIRSVAGGQQPQIDADLLCTANGLKIGAHARLVLLPRQVG
jgi:hypothetical protein